jgi:hypothetical protein
MQRQMITIHNRGPLIVATNYWESELAKAGKIFCSVNAGAIRVLLPPLGYRHVEDMRGECVLSRGPWPELDLPEAVEILWDDGSPDPFVLHLSPESFDVLPAQPEPDREWVISVWVYHGELLNEVEFQGSLRPHNGFGKVLEQVCHWRRVEKIPCMLPWPKE